MYSDSYGEVAASATTSLLISVELGEYTVADGVGGTPGYPSVVAVPVDGAGPTIVAVHAAELLRDRARPLGATTPLTVPGNTLVTVSWRLRVLCESV